MPISKQPKLKGAVKTSWSCAQFGMRSCCPCVATPARAMLGSVCAPRCAWSLLVLVEQPRTELSEASVWPEMVSGVVVKVVSGKTCRNLNFIVFRGMIALGECILRSLENHVFLVAVVGKFLRL